jgi:zinc/manganese transport system permease protein
MSAPGRSVYGVEASGWWPFHIVWTWWSWNLPADLHQMLLYAFIREAFEAGTIIAVLAGVVSYLVVLRRSSFAAHALGHVGFSGAAAAVLFAVNPFWGLLLFTTVSGGGIALLGKKAAHRDVEIGTVLAFMLGLGLMFLAFYQGFATQVYSILFGDIVAINQAQVWLTFYAALAVLGVLAFVYRQLLFASLDEEVAEAKGMHTMLLGVVFMLALAVVISVAVTVIGVLLIFALAVTPAAAAVRLVRRPLHTILVSVGIALFATWAGIFIAFWEVEPTSFFIVTIVFVIYVIARAVPVNSGAVVPARATTAPPARAIPMHPQGAAPFSLPLEPTASPSSEAGPA